MNFVVGAEGLKMFRLHTITCNSLCCRMVQTERQRDWASKLSGSSLLSRLAATQKICIQRLSLENKGGFPYIPFRAGYRNGGEGAVCPVNGHILFHWLF
jgi:hypothetical protein